MNESNNDTVAVEAARPTGVSKTPVSWNRDMNVCVDYLRVTFDGTFDLEKRGLGPYKKLIDAYRILDEEPITPQGGRGGYARTYSFGESMLIFAGGQNTKNKRKEETFSIEIKGQGCREFEDRVRYKHFEEGEEAWNNAIHDAWLNLFLTIAEYHGRCTRIDVPTDDFSGLIPIDELKKKFEDHAYSSSLRTRKGRKPNKKGEEDDDGCIVIETNDGWSVTLGGRETCQLCVYNKLAEQKQKTYAKFNTTYWIRYEVRYFHNAAMTALNELTTAYQNENHRRVVEMIVGCLKDKLDIKERASRHTRKEETWSKWAEFMKEAMEIHIVAQKRPESTIESNAQWLMEDATKCLGKIAGVLREDMIPALLYLLFEGINKIEEEEIHVINAHQRRNNMPGYASVEEYREAMMEAFGKTSQPVSENIRKLFNHDVFKLGSARYTEEDFEESEDNKEGE